MMLAGAGVAALLSIASCTKAPTPESRHADASALAATVDSLNRALGAAVAAKDSNTILAFYDSEAVMLPPNGRRASGSDEIRMVWAGFMAIPQLTLALQSIKVFPSEAGDLVVDTGSYALHGMGPKSAIADTGKYVTTFKKTDAGWKIVADIWNSDLPLPAH
jgi:ketosteroid isomerase-like protein